MENDLGLEAIDPSNLILANRRATIGEAVTNLDADPQKVGRAYELARATGDKPALVYSDLDNYEEQHKAALTAQLLASSDHLRQYIDADPMHAKLSNDDWPNLDAVSEKIGKFRKYLHEDTPLGLPTREDGVIASAIHGFLDHMRESQGQLTGVKTSELRDYPLGTAILKTAEAPFDLLGGVFKGITEGIRTGVEGMGGSPQLARDLAAAAEMQFMGQGVHGTPKPTAKQAAEGAMNFWERNPEYQKVAEKVYRAAEDTRLWLDSGKEPPAGLNRDIDKIKLDQNNEDIKHLDEMIKDAQSSATRERDPDTFARFVRMRDEGNIAIDGEAVAKLYGDKVPELEDGLLGFHDGIGRQLETARATGADIEIPIADFLAKVDPEVYKALKDDIRVRPGGITKNEAKVAGEQRELVDREPLGGDLPQMRAATALEPLFSIGDRRLKLEKEERRPDAYKAPGTEFHNFSIRDEADQHVGFLNLSVSEKNPKDIYVDMVGGSRGRGVMHFGPALMRDLKRQIKEFFPEAERLGGHRVTGMRDKFETFDKPSAMVWVKLDKDWSAIDAQQVRQIFSDHEYKPLGQGLEAAYKPTDLLSERELDLAEAIGTELERLTPKQADFSFPSQIRKQDTKQQIRGVHLSYGDRNPFIVVALDSSDPIGVARHEAIHHLRQQGFFTDGEWSTLERAARDEGWIEKFGIDRRYANLETSAKLEEAIADGFRKWKEGQAVPEKVRPMFERLKELFEAIKAKINEIFGREVSWQELFQKVDEGEIGQREGNAPRREGAYKESIGPFEPPKPANDRTNDDANWKRMDYLIQQMDEINNKKNPSEFDWRRFSKYREELYQLREISSPIRPKFSVGEEPELPQDQRPLFRTPATIGMTEKQVRLYERALRDMHEADEVHAQKIAEKEQKRRLTAEWKTERKNVRSEVEAEMNSRPDVAADLFFARGELYGEKLGERYKIDYEDLTPEQRTQLPKDYVGKKGDGGVDLDDVAGLVGFPDGKAMVEHLTAYNKAKLEANMSAKAFRDRMVEIETDRQMAGRYGKLEDNILDAVKDQVTSETQLNLVAEEILALGIRNKGEATINKAELRAWIEDKFAESPVATQSSDKYLKAAGKKGTAAEIALLQDKIDAAYREKQGQYLALSLAKEARALEKEQKQFAKTVAKLSKREIKGLDTDYQDHIQTLLWQAGFSPRRSMIEIQRSQAISGKGSLDAFVAESAGDGWAPEVSGDLLAGRIAQVKDMTVAQFREFKDAIDSLNYIGRQVDKINREGRKEEFNDYKREVLDNITSLPKRTRESQERGLAHIIYGADAEMTRVEVMMKALDLGQDMGPLVDMTIRPMAEAKHKEYSLQEKLSKDIKAIETSKEWKKSLREELPNDWFKDPSVDGGGLFKIRRMDLINIMLNWGNKSNRAKFTRGWGSLDPARGATKAEAAAFEAKMKDYIDTHATAEDWKFVQGVWDIYNGYRGDMETVWRNTSGTQPKLIEPLEIETPHGTMKGGYYPLIRDRYMSGAAKPEISNNSLFGADYPNYSTPQGHLKERTGATYFVDFRAPLERIPLRMQQVIHDIAFRDAVMAAKQVIGDRDIMKAIANHYGSEYAEQLRPWLERVARGATLDETALGFRDRVLRQTRMNLVNYALPLNYVVTYTPDVGAPTPRSMINYFKDREANKALANSLSKEIPHAIYNMDRDFREAMERAVGAGKLTQAKAAATRWGYGIVSYVSREFRTATFIDKFNENKALGKSDADAAAIADTYVRERHGSAALADLPAIMAGGEAGRLLTMFYGYWNTQFNWLRTIKGDVQRGEYMKAIQTAYGTILVGAFFGATVANQAYREDTMAKRALKAIPMQLGGMIPYGIREATMYVAEGAPPRTPIGSVIQSVAATANDINHWFRGDKPVDKGIRHGSAAAGLLLGVPGTLQLGRTAQGLWDVHKGKQHPRDIYEWVRLLHTGEAQLKSKGQR